MATKEEKTDKKPLSRKDITVKAAKARAESLSPERRKEIAFQAAMARWGKHESRRAAMAKFQPSRDKLRAQVVHALREVLQFECTRAEEDAALLALALADKGTLTLNALADVGFTLGLEIQVSIWVKP